MENGEKPKRAHREGRGEGDEAGSWSLQIAEETVVQKGHLQGIYRNSYRSSYRLPTQSTGRSAAADRTTAQDQQNCLKLFKILIKFRATRDGGLVGNGCASKQIS